MSAPIASADAAKEIERWLVDEIDGGPAPSSVHRPYRTMRRMFHVAVEKWNSSHGVGEGLGQVPT